jgi:hypothetical protein
MGLLDDAIREHLDLKRRHGADPNDVARQEREAFGPGPMPPAPAAAGAEPAESVGGTATETADAPPPFDDDADGLPTASEALPAAPEPAAPPPAAEPSRDELHGSVSADRFAPADDDIDWSEPTPLREPDPQAGPEAAADEDVLEETPEFLQETPDHDRLWFEQRPPKDFDF